MCDHCVHIDMQSSGLHGDEAYFVHFALQNGVECRAAEAELVLVRLRWRTHEADVFLSLPMSLEKEKSSKKCNRHHSSSIFRQDNFFVPDGRQTDLRVFGNGSSGL